MSPQYIVAHDVGTGGNKAVLADTEGRTYASAFQPYAVHYPRPDWAEQEPEDWWHAVATTTRQVLERSGVAPRALQHLAQIGRAHV